jgi:hypothetical protein
METLGIDTIAGTRLLQLKLGSAGAFQPDQPVVHEDRRAGFIRISDAARSSDTGATATRSRFLQKRSVSQRANWISLCRMRAAELTLAKRESDPVRLGRSFERAADSVRVSTRTGDTHCVRGALDLPTATSDADRSRLG